MDLPEPKRDLEERLGVFSDAEACEEWDQEPIYYLYAFRDPLQFDLPIIYVGQGKGGRMRNHWNHTHNDILEEWIDYWKKSSVNFEDVTTQLLTGLTQRESCCLETYIISKFKPLANKKYYWTPDQSATHSEDERRHHSKLMTGRKQPKEGIQRSAKSRTNKYTLELYREDELVEVFKNTTAIGVTNWILENHRILIAPSSLWATISQKKGRQTKGYRLVEPAGESGLKSKTKTLRSIKGHSVITKDVNGNSRIFVSSTAAAEALNINGGDLGSVLRNSYSQSGGYSARNLTEDEINENYQKWPAYYKIKINNTEHYTFNLSSFCRSHKLVIGTVHKRLSMGKGYSITNGMKISGSIVHKHSSLELFDVEIIDDLPIPSPLPVAEKQSDVKGVFWTGSKRKWEIKILIVHKEINFGSTVNQDIAVRVAEYVLANLDEPKIIESGRNLLKELKSAAGEQTKDSQLNKHSGTGKDRLIRAAELGEELLELSLPSGNKKRNEWLNENYEIDLRRAQRYMQIARGRQNHPDKFNTSESISTFLEEIAFLETLIKS